MAVSFHVLKPRCFGASARASRVGGGGHVLADVCALVHLYYTGPSSPGRPKYKVHTYPLAVYTFTGDLVDTDSGGWPLSRLHGGVTLVQPTGNRNSALHLHNLRTPLLLRTVCRLQLRPPAYVTARRSSPRLSIGCASTSASSLPPPAAYSPPPALLSSTLDLSGREGSVRMAKIFTPMRLRPQRHTHLGAALDTPIPHPCRLLLPSRDPARNINHPSSLVALQTLVTASTAPR